MKCAKYFFFRKDNFDFVFFPRFFPGKFETKIVPVAVNVIKLFRRKSKTFPKKKKVKKVVRMSEPAENVKTGPLAAYFIT